MFKGSIGYLVGKATLFYEVRLKSSLHVQSENNHRLRIPLKYNTNVYWIFLPAGIRMFSVFIFGWSGVAGLFLGHVLTNHAETSNQLLYLAVVSSLSPMLAKRICKWFFNIPASLEGLTGRQLLVFTLACAFADASLSSQHFYHIGTFKYDHDFAPLFAGDLLGTLIILYLSKWLLGCFVKIYKPSF